MSSHFQNRHLHLALPLRTYPTISDINSPCFPIVILILPMIWYYQTVKLLNNDQQDLSYLSLGTFIFILIYIFLLS
jgi:hypothetical protein